MKPQMVKNLLISQIKTAAADAKSFCIDVERKYLTKKKTDYGKSHYCFGLKMATMV